MKRPHEQRIAGSVDDARILPHLRQRSRTEQRTLVEQQARVLREAVATSPTGERPITKTTGPAGGDPRQLRGIPAIGRNVTGATQGSRPDHDAPSLRNRAA